MLSCPRIPLRILFYELAMFIDVILLLICASIGDISLNGSVVGVSKTAESHPSESDLAIFALGICILC